jgi:hypothetical protein
MGRYRKLVSGAPRRTAELLNMLRPANKPSNFIRLNETKATLRMGLGLLVIGILGGLLFAHLKRSAPGNSGEWTESSEPVDFARTEATDFSQPEVPVYAYSLIPGGISSVEGFHLRVLADPVLASYMRECDWSTATEFSLAPAPARQRQMAYRMGATIKWTRKPVRLFRYEPAIALHCGKYTRWFLDRCGNEVFNPPAPRTPVGDLPPTVFEYPQLPPTPPGPSGPPGAPAPPVFPETPPVTSWIPPGGPPPGPPTGTTTTTATGVFPPACCIYGTRPEVNLSPTGVAAAEPGTVAMVAIAFALLATIAWRKGQRARRSSTNGT